MGKSCSFQNSNVWTSFSLLFFLILSVYSNSFNATWQFDDKPNILNNYYLHIENLSPKTLAQTLYTNPSNPFQLSDRMFRPTACLTFALNWYFGKDNVIGYHAVNLMIHALTAFILYLFVFYLLKCPNLKDRFGGSGHFIALLSAVLWGINPIQTQAVTYIVQRMTSLAGMFYILGMYLYIRGRMSRDLRNRIIWMFFCLFSFLFAMGSKQIAAMFPFALLLVEIIFFQDHTLPLSRKRVFFISMVAASSIILIGIMFISHSGISVLLNGYSYRPFSLPERLMTESRIVLFYISQIFYPLPHRLSIEHDVMVSTSMLTPWATLPSIIMIILLIGLGFFLIRKKPIISFAILFFFLHQVIESSFIPLELIFEHRNYLPSFFVFFPVSVGIKWLIDFYRVRNKSIYIFLVSFLSLFLIFFGMGTYIRNMAWANEKSLWLDAMRKAPMSARPLTSLAWEMASGKNSKPEYFDLALRLYEKALPLKKTKTKMNSIILNNMADIHYKRGEIQKAVNLLNQALVIDPDYHRGRYNLTIMLIDLGNMNEAMKQAHILVESKNPQGKYFNIRGFILLKQKKYEAAIKNFEKSLTFSPYDKDTLINLGVALSIIGDHSKAEWFLRRANKIPPADMMTFFSLIENSIKAGNVQLAERYTDSLISSFKIVPIRKQLVKIQNDYISVPVSSELIADMISKRLLEMSKDIKDRVKRQL